MKKTQTEGQLEIKIQECTLKLESQGSLREYRDGRQISNIEDNMEGIDT